MMFIFSIMQYGSNQLGPSTTKKSLTNSGNFHLLQKKDIYFCLNEFF